MQIDFAKRWRASLVKSDLRLEDLFSTFLINYFNETQLSARPRRALCLGGVI